MNRDTHEICRNCGTLGATKTGLRGSPWIELVLWLCYLVPGIIYSIWRRKGNTTTCTACGSKELVSIITPVGRQLLAQYHPDVDFDDLRRDIALSSKPKAADMPWYVVVGVILFAIMLTPMLFHS